MLIRSHLNYVRVGRSRKTSGLSAECGAALQAVVDPAKGRLGTLSG